MVATQGQGSAARRPSPSSTRFIGGIGLMFAGVALMSYGAHFLARTGTCSGTGYVSYGPVPKCGGGEALYIMSAFFVGPVAAIVGWLMAQAWGWLWPAVCVGVGTGLITIRNETTAAAGARAFGLVGGICLFALAGLSVTVSVRKRRRPRTAREGGGPGITVLPNTPAPNRLAPATARAATADLAGTLAMIARLAQLRDSGVLSEDEFQIQKAKLLAEI